MTIVIDVFQSAFQVLFEQHSHRLWRSCVRFETIEGCHGTVCLILANSNLQIESLLHVAARGKKSGKTQATRGGAMSATWQYWVADGMLRAPEKPKSGEASVIVPPNLVPAGLAPYISISLPTFGQFGSPPAAYHAAYLFRSLFAQLSE